MLLLSSEQKCGHKDRLWWGAWPWRATLRQNHTRLPSDGHSAERQLLIASGGPQSMSQQNNAELQKRCFVRVWAWESVVLVCVCVHWLDLSHLSASVVVWISGWPRVRAVQNVIYWCVENNQLTNDLLFLLFTEDCAVCRRGCTYCCDYILFKDSDVDKVCVLWVTLVW